MIGILIRLAMGKSIGGFWTGLAMLVTGVLLTLASAVLTLSVGAGVTVVFFGLIIGGLIRMVVSAPALFSGGSGAPGRTRATGARGPVTGAPGPMPFVAPPTQMRPGYCWMCGGKVRRGNVMCLHCGAAQPSLGGSAQESEVAHLSGFDPSGSSSAIPSAPYPQYPSYMSDGPAPMPGGRGRGPTPGSGGNWGSPPGGWRR